MDLGGTQLVPPFVPGLARPGPLSNLVRWPSKSRSATSGSPGWWG